jgi:cytochrome oxidase Cu insertion factor (SCO1/SenC/PrrC family)
MPAKPETIEPAGAEGPPGASSLSSGGGEAGGPLTPEGRRWGRGTLALLLLAVLVVALGAADLVVYHARSDQPADLRVSGIPPSVPTSLANLMSLSPVPASPSPNFELADQAGHTVSLSGFRGHPVVLEFIDSHCTDICPIVSQEFVAAAKELGPASGTVFVGVNVNQYHNQIGDVVQFSQAQHLTTIPTWHFVTGPVGALRQVWSDYHVAVEAPSPNADIIHTSVLYFIDPNGNERYIATPEVDHTANGTVYEPANLLTAWAHGIALVASSLAG